MKFNNIRYPEKNYSFVYNKSRYMQNTNRTKKNYKIHINYICLCSTFCHQINNILGITMEYHIYLMLINVMVAMENVLLYIKHMRLTNTCTDLYNFKYIPVS